MNKLLTLMLLACCILTTKAASKYDNPDTLVVARDGTGQFRNVADAIEVCRAFMEYHKVTPLTAQGEPKKIGTFRTFTLKIQGQHITLKNITIENNSARLGQAVALHTEGDRLTFINCRFLGHQDTIYTGNAKCRHYFKDCYIEGTTDFIFGPSTAWFENCDIFCKANSYITAASTPQDVKYGYIFNNCRITTASNVDKVYLGRPWRDYGYTLFMNCELPKQIRPEGWHQWRPEAVKTARYLEYNNHGEGAATDKRVSWSRQLTKKEAQQITLQQVFSINDVWAIGK